MKNKKIISLTMATVMAISGGPILTGCNQSGGQYKDFKNAVSEQDDEDKTAGYNNVFRGGHAGNPFFYFSGSGNTKFDSVTSSGWKSWSVKRSNSTAIKASDGSSYSSSKAVSFTG